MAIIKNKIYNENNIITMKRIDNNSINGIITSPPYNVATKRKDNYYNNGYSDIDNLTEEEYLDTRIKEFKEFERMVKNDGVILYNISYQKENPILPTLLISKIHNETNLTIADIICWKKSNSIPFQSSSNKLSRLSELIYVIVNKDYLHTFKANKEISKINEKTGQKFFKHYTNVIEARNNDSKKAKNKATYSTELVEKLIHIYFPQKSIIYDPFIGIGTTAKGCISKGCYFIGSELSKEFFEEMKLNINEYIKQRKTDN